MKVKFTDNYWDAAVVTGNIRMQLVSINMNQPCY